MECKNCHTPFSNETDFCPSCGGKVIRNRLTIKSLFAHFSEQFINYDNKFLKTFLHLFTKPEKVIDGYINGTRKRYVNVISYFAIAITLSGLQMFILNKFFPEMMDFSAMKRENQPDFGGEGFMDSIMEYQSLTMMLSVPFVALISKIVFFNIKKYNYTEHLVIYMYILAQTSILGIIIMITSAFIKINVMNVSFFTTSIMILYSAYTLKRLYTFSLKRIIIKTLIFFPILLFFYIVVLFVGTAIYFFLNPEMFQQMIDTQKSLQNS